MIVPIYVMTHDESMPEDELCYIVGKNGFYLKKANFLGKGIFKTNEISELMHLAEGIVWQLPKVPISLLYRTMKFFRGVEKKYGSEAVLLLLYNEETSEYILYVPNQKVSKNEVEILDDLRFIDQQNPIVGMFHYGTSIHRLRNSPYLIDGVHVIVKSAGIMPELELYFARNNKDYKGFLSSVFDRTPFHYADTEPWHKRVKKKVSTYYGGRYAQTGRFNDFYYGY